MKSLHCVGFSPQRFSFCIQVLERHITNLAVVDNGNLFIVVKEFFENGKEK